MVGPRFRYTGQLILPEAKLYYYKARVYDPVYGRFLQTDPVGTKDDLDLYAYVGDDPINHSDPTGLVSIPVEYVSRNSGSLKVKAYPGEPAVPDPNAIKEHGPDHIHVFDGKKEVRINTETWKPLEKKDTLNMTRGISNWIKKLTPEAKSYISSAQRDVFNTGKISGPTNELGMQAVVARNRQSADEGLAAARAAGRKSNVPPALEEEVIRNYRKSGKDDD